MNFIDFRFLLIAILFAIVLYILNVLLKEVRFDRKMTAPTKLYVEGDKKTIMEVIEFCKPRLFKGLVALDCTPDLKPCHEHYCKCKEEEE